MKIIFLDIDGVLNQTGNAASLPFDPNCVMYLNHVIKETGAHIVISSAWRYQILEGHMTLKGFEFLMKTHGLDRCAEN